MSGTGVVTFSYATWSATYPEFATTVSSEQADVYFTIAETLLDNTPCSPVRNLMRRATLLNMIVAHIAQLFTGSTGSPASQAVGRIASASEGSVSVSLDMGTQPTAAAWWMQTRYGALYWTATAQYRTARYRPGPQPYLGVSAPFGFIGPGSPRFR